jgi:hypothetical protein
MERPAGDRRAFPFVGDLPDVLRLVYHDRKDLVSMRSQLDLPPAPTEQHSEAPLFERTA